MDLNINLSLTDPQISGLKWGLSKYNATAEKPLAFEEFLGLVIQWRAALFADDQRAERVRLASEKLKEASPETIAAVEAAIGLAADTSKDIPIGTKP